MEKSPYGGGLLLVGSGDETDALPRVRLVDAADGWTRHDLEVPDGALQCLAVCLSADGSQAAAGFDSSWVLWDCRSGQQLLRVESRSSVSYDGHSGEVSGIGFSPCGRRLVTCGGHRVVIWDVDTGEPQLQLVGHKGTARTAVFSPRLTSPLVACGGDDRTVYVWDTQSGDLVRTIQDVDSETMAVVAFACDGQRIVTAGVDDTCKTWDADNVFLSIEGHDATVNSVAFSPDGAALVTGSDDSSVRLWNIEGDPVLWLAVHPEGPHMNGCACREGDPHPECPIVEAHSAAVKAVCYSGAGHVFASGSADGSCKVWDGASGAPLIRTIDMGWPVACLAFQGVP